jgi:hypothetical protein
MLIIPAILESHRSLKDKSLKLTFETQEPTPEQLVAIAMNTQKFGFLAFKDNPFKEKEKEMLSTIKSDFEDTGKSKAQRLRGVLYRNWEQQSDDYKVFDDYYNHHMEVMITHWKNKLD